MTTRKWEAWKAGVFPFHTLFLVCLSQSTTRQADLGQHKTYLRSTEPEKGCRCPSQRRRYQRRLSNHVCFLGSPMAKLPTSCVAPNPCVVLSTDTLHGLLISLWVMWYCSSQTLTLRVTHVQGQHSFTSAFAMSTYAATSQHAHRCLGPTTPRPSFSWVAGG